MKKINFKVQEPYYSFLISGTKTIEGRLNKGKFAELTIGDILVLEPKNTPFKVTAVKAYKTFSEMLQKEGVQNIIPDKKTIADAVDIYYSFYTPADERKYGVIAISLEKLTK